MKCRERLLHFFPFQGTITAHTFTILTTAHVGGQKYRSDHTSNRLHFRCGVRRRKSPPSLAAEPVRRTESQSKNCGSASFPPTLSPHPTNRITHTPTHQSHAPTMTCPCPPAFATIPYRPMIPSFLPSNAPASEYHPQITQIDTD